VVAAVLGRLHRQTQVGDQAVALPPLAMLVALQAFSVVSLILQITSIIALVGKVATLRLEPRDT